MKDMEIGSFEAKNKLSALLVAVEQGQRIMITRRGRRVAMLTAPDDGGAAGKSTSAEEVLKGFQTVRCAANAPYLELADRLQCPLLTNDHKLRDAANQLGLS